MHTLHVIIEGRVQGVGFRHATYLEATTLSLTGWVRNCRDGRVEAKFDGPKDSLEKMLTWCQKGPILSKVTHVQTHWTQCTQPCETFDITFH